MVPFAGFNMPVQYAGLKEEHHAVRDHVGMFDVSHMGEFFVSGPDALALVQWVSSNDASALFDGKVQYSCMPNGRGGIVDDLLVYRMAEDRYMLVVNASNRAKDWAWIQSQVDEKGFDVSLEDASDRHALIALQGPEAQRVLGQLSPSRKDGQPWEELTYYTFAEGTLLGSNVLVSATGYTGAGGVEIYVAPEGVKAIWRALLDAGVPPCGLGARDTLRMEMGFCLYGNDIDDHHLPHGRRTGLGHEVHQGLRGRRHPEGPQVRRHAATAAGTGHGRPEGFLARGTTWWTRQARWWEPSRAERCPLPWAMASGWPTLTALCPAWARTCSSKSETKGWPATW